MMRMLEVLFETRCYGKSAGVWVGQNHLEECFDRFCACRVSFAVEELRSVFVVSFTAWTEFHCGIFYDRPLTFPVSQGELIVDIFQVGWAVLQGNSFEVGAK
jgi:hypothetical protein